MSGQSDEIEPYRQYGRRIDDGPSGREYEDMKDRVKTVEDKLDRIIWLLVLTLGTTLADIIVRKA